MPVGRDSKGRLKKGFTIKNGRTVKAAGKSRKKATRRKATRRRR